MTRAYELFCDNMIRVPQAIITSANGSPKSLWLITEYTFKFSIFSGGLGVPIAKPIYAG